MGGIDGDLASWSHREGTSYVTAADNYGYPSYPVGWRPTKLTGNHSGSYYENWWHSYNTGGDYNSLGFWIDQMEAKCTGSPTGTDNTLYIMRNTPYDAFLLGTSDVIYAWTTQPANHRLVIVVWPGNRHQSQFDFDVFANWHGQKLPNPFTADASSVNGSDPSGNMYPEMIIVPTTTSARTVYIALGSYSGKGHVRLYANAAPDTYPHSMDVMTNYSPTWGDRQHIKMALKKWAMALHWATEGKSMITNFDLYWNKVPPDTTKPMFKLKYTLGSGACFNYLPGESPQEGQRALLATEAWCGCNKEVDINCACTYGDSDLDNASYWFMHEWGHCFVDDDMMDPARLGLLYDERCDYQPTPWWPNQLCMHSVMGDAPSYPNQNGGIDFCHGSNGGLNADLLPCYGVNNQAGHSSSVRNWPIIENLWPSTPPIPSNRTPDPFAGIGMAEYGVLPNGPKTVFVEHWSQP